MPAVSELSQQLCLPCTWTGSRRENFSALSFSALPHLGATIENNYIFLLTNLSLRVENCKTLVEVCVENAHGKD